MDDDETRQLTARCDCPEEYVCEHEQAIYAELDQIMRGDEDDG